MKKKILQNIKELFDFSMSTKYSEKLSLEIFIGFGAILGSLYIFVKLSHKIIYQEMIFFDKIIMESMYSMRSGQITLFMKTITFFGGEIFLTSAILLTIILLTRKHIKDSIVFGFILIFGIFLNLLLKGVFERARPDVLSMVAETTFSFPSGHTMNSFVFFLGMTYFIFRRMRNRQLGLLLILLTGMMTLLIGISRIYLGAHYPSDVLGGFAAGLVWFVAVLLFEKTLLYLRLFREYELNKKY